MEFHDGWSLLAFFIYLVGGLICWGLAAAGWEGEDRHPARKKWITGLILFTIGFAAVNGVAWGTSVSSVGDRSATVGEVTQQFGLTSGNEYPLVLGSRINGSSGSGYVSGNFFSIYGESSTQPATAISISFTHGDASYILEIPTSKITFKKSEGPSKVQLFLYDRDLYDNYAENSPARTTYTYGACRLVMVNFWLNCVKPQTSVKTILDGAVQRQGLSPVVAKNLDSAVITLTPSTYKQLLG